MNRPHRTRRETAANSEQNSPTNNQPTVSPTIQPDRSWTEWIKFSIAILVPSKISILTIYIANGKAVENERATRLLDIKN